VGHEPSFPIIGAEDVVPNGTIIVGFDAKLPVDAETCRQQIAVNIARGLPDILKQRGLTIIANGPSAIGIDLRAIKGPTLAVNGAIKLFVEQGLAPTYWAVCDPQAKVADFQPDDPPFDTTYLVASKCHPSVFDKLADRDVRLWHLTDHSVPGHARVTVATSVTISATWLMHAMGFTDFEYHGWDGCYIGDRHHASDASVWDHTPLEINYGGKIEGDNVIGGRTFSSTRTWAAEATDAEQFFQLARYFDLGITINGDGMFKCAREFILHQGQGGQP
jgi:hypothetical protein